MTHRTATHMVEAMEKHKRNVLMDRKIFLLPQAHFMFMQACFLQNVGK